MSNEKFISADDPRFTYMGRVDHSAANSAAFYYAGSQVSFGFTGDSLRIVVNNYRIYNISQVGYILDGIQGKLDIDVNDVDTVLEIPGIKGGGEHTLTVFKRQDAAHFYSFKGVYINEDAELFSTKKEYSMRIEAFGDSVSAGSLCEANYYVGMPDPDADLQGAYDNAYFSFISIAARLLNAELNNNSQGGIALFDGTGYYHAPDFIGLETTWDKLGYIPEGGISQWDFSRFTPDIVIIAIGQNDNHVEGCEDNDINEPVYRSRWKDGYAKLIEKLHGKYPSARFVLTTTLLIHDPERDRVIGEVADMYDYAYHNVFTRNGAATPGHPRISEEAEMAAELSAFIRKIMGIN